MSDKNVERGVLAWFAANHVAANLLMVLLIAGGTIAAFGLRKEVVPEITDRCVILNGVAKTYAMTGWRVGWMIAPPAVAKAGMRLQSHMTSNVNNIAQVAATAAVAGPLDAVYEMRDAFDRRRRTMYSMLSLGLAGSLSGVSSLVAVTWGVGATTTARWAPSGLQCSSDADPSTSIQFEEG